MDEWDIDMKTGDVKQTKKEGKEIVRLNKNGENISKMEFDEKSIALINDKKELAKDEEGNPLTNTILKFTNSEDAQQVFNKIAGFFGDNTKESEVEWDYIKGGVGEGYLQTSGEKDKIVSNFFHPDHNNITEWRHYHPSNNAEPYIVSILDHNHAINMKVPSYLHYNRNTKGFRFDDWNGYKNIEWQRTHHR